MIMHLLFHLRSIFRCRSYGGLTCISSPAYLSSGARSAARRRVSAEDQPRRAAAAGPGAARGLLPRARDGAEVPAAARAGAAGARGPERHHLGGGGGGVYWGGVGS